MATTFWSFGSGFDGWTFEDTSGANGSASRTHVSGAIRNTVVYTASPPNDRAASCNNTSPTSLNAAIANNDTIELDYSASTGTNGFTSISITATYTDTTTEIASFASVVGAGTKTLTLTQSKTLDFITVRIFIFTNMPGALRTETRDIEEVRLITATELTPTAGLLRTPTAFIEDEGAGAAGGAGGGSGGNIADISADGLSIYIASFNNLGFPTLIKMSALLAADGSVVFDPLAGGRIGVQTGELNAETVWVAGDFGGTDTVEKSEDAGVSFTVKDDASFGTVRTFQVGPSDDNRMLVFDGDNGDILETLDDGETWRTINAAVTPLINSIARLSTNLQEIVAGNAGDATDSINYSPNSGVNLEDYQVGVYPNADATKVQVT